MLWTTTVKTNENTMETSWRFHESLMEVPQKYRGSTICIPGRTLKIQRNRHGILMGAMAVRNHFARTMRT